LGVLGIVGKFVKDVVHLWRQNYENIILFSSYKLPIQQTTTFEFQGILGLTSKGLNIRTTDNPVLGSVT
jgi:hypothetical protein